MNKQNLVILITAMVLVLAGALWMNAKREPITTIEEDRVLPGLLEGINDVSALRITAPGGAVSVTVSKQAEAWIVEEKGNYPADTGKLRETLLGLANATIVEQKTSNPELYSKLGVEDVGSEDASGRQIEIDGLGESIGLIIGESSRGGTYVRRADSDRSLLISESVTIDTDPLNWLDREIISLEDSRIQQVTIEHAGRGTVTVSRDTRDQTDFALQQLPAERELSSPSSANVIASAVNGLRMEDVKPLDTIGFDGLVQTLTTFRAFDGLVVAAHTFDLEGKKFVRLEASFDESTAARFATAQTADESETDSSAATEPSGDENTADTPETPATTEAAADTHEAVPQEVELLSAQYNGWAYEIPSYKYEQFTKTAEDLLKPLDE